MKKVIIRGISIFLALALVLGYVPVLRTEARAVTINQQNIADRADFFFNTTWVCQKDVNAWRDEFVFKKGETYHLPYGQPVNSGKFIGYGVELEDFLMAAADADSVFYSTQSEFNGWTSVYYATDCAAFVAMCWGTVRQDCSTLPYYSTYKGKPTEENVYNILQLGDALDSTSVGHVVLVSDLIYDSDGNLIQIEITEQTPPQLKRTYFTPTELADKYGEEFGIYRYEGSVPAVPEWGYTTECTNYAAYCTLEITADTPVMSLPCTSAVNDQSIQLGNVVSGQLCTATRLYSNTSDELWYRIKFQGDDVGYIPAENTVYREMLLDDISLTDAVYPNAHVRGKTFSLVGNIGARYNQLVTASGYIYQGFGSDSSPITGATDYVTGNAYTLKSSQIDYSTSFGDLTTGNHTIAFSVDYRNYHVEQGKIIEHSGTLDLAKEYFMVVSSATNQNSCNHHYTETTLTLGNCTQPALRVYACSACGYVYKESGVALGHSFGDCYVTNPTCTQDGAETSVCTVCGETEIKVLQATGHQYFEKFVEGSCLECPHYIYTCTSCGDEYIVYPEEVMAPWQETLPEGIAPALVETKTQYRSSELNVIVSSEKELDGHTYIGVTWEPINTDTLDYVKQFPSGFDTTDPLYAQYHKTPMANYESEDEKVIIESDIVTGYLYYHWCYQNSYFSQASKGGQYSIFHAYYSTTKPDTYRVDTSDWSYCTAHDTCSNTDWFFVVEVNSQTASTQQKMYLQGKWQAYSEWSDVPAEASDMLRVETRTLYRYPDLNIADHQYDATETKPTCTQAGLIVYTCSLCGETYSEVLPAIGHHYESTTIAPTCTEQGYTIYNCACGDRYTSDFNEALGHNYETSTIEANCTEDGSCTKTCTYCADTQVEIIPATGHQFEVTVTSPTCTENGYTTYACNCGYNETTSEIPALGHRYQRTIIEAGCTQDGSITEICDRCNDTQVEIITAMGHQYEASITAPTCTESGYTTYTCTCGDSYISDVTQVTDHTYQMEMIDATCTEDGSIRAICSTCGSIKTGVIPATGHRYENGTCTACGEAEVTHSIKPTLTLKSPTLEFKDTICIVAFYTAENTQDVVEMGMITYKNNVTEVSIATADYVIPGAALDPTSGRYFSNSQGIHAKNLADTIYLACYAKLTDGSYVYTKLAPYSPVTYAKSQLKNATNTALKQLVVAMLNYGTEAQVYFGHNLENLANASLTVDQAALPEIYRDDMVSAVPAPTAAKQGGFVNNSGFSSRKPAVSFEGAFCINYFFTPKYAPADGITLYYWYENDYNSTDILTASNASGSIKLDGSGTNQYRGDITGISAKKLSQAIYVTAVYSDGTTTWTSGVLGYSIGAYCSSQVSKGEDVADLAMATAIYGYHAKQYFG